MKILVISGVRDSMPLVLRLIDEGHEVFTYVEKAKEDPEQYKGLAPQIPAWKEKLSWCDFVFFDNNHGLSAIREAVYKAGKPAFNMVFSKKDITIAGKTLKPWDFLLAMEDERAWGHSIMESFGIGKVVPRWEFTELNKAAEFIKSRPGRYVLKVEGDAPSDSTYLGICDDGEDLIKYLETYPDRAEGVKVKKVELEKFIKGIEIGCGGYFNGAAGWSGIDINFEHKKFLDCPYSFLTGEQGTVIRAVRDHKLFRETLFKMTEFLKEIDFRGNIDINGVLTAAGFYPYEFTTGRPGYPAMWIEMEGRKVWGNFVAACAYAKNLHFEVNTDWLIGVVICGKGYPFYKEVGADKMKYMPVIIHNPEVLKHLQLLDVRAMKDGIYTTNAYVGCATAAGKTLQEAQKKVYNMLPEIMVPNTYYRKDIGDRVSREMAELEKRGYGFEEPKDEKNN